MEDIFKKSILFDLYGGILNENQKLVYEYHVIDDLSFAEIGEELGISRQAAYDLFKTADKKLKSIESRLELSERFKNIEKYAKDIMKLANGNSKIINLSNKIIEKTLKGGNN